MRTYLITFWDFPFYDDRAELRLRRNCTDIMRKNLMKTDIKETKHGYELEMDLPGFTKDEVKVELNKVI